MNIVGESLATVIVFLFFGLVGTLVGRGAGKSCSKNCVAEVEVNRIGYFRNGKLFILSEICIHLIDRTYGTHLHML